MKRGNPVPLLASEGWHRFVTGFCLFASVCLIVTGAENLFQLTDSFSIVTKPNVRFSEVMLIFGGLLAFRFFLKELRK